ncbi:MAG TPA: restriction endonuclease [Algoriphagus sp.]|jgi:restriction system protein|uniref:restriction endonuclease n=1 Tax=unclassified Algoriphagus TaxID=2641541 RepID=UPI000C45EA5A|nr:MULTISPECIES: restriction endonuclease [unclassified Algoriphagus]MAL12423.1 restriction endonuclease [Algoriphagus sp.]HAD50413.1 restriction endonuclease [Algoriphagus sp.]HAH35275.1 restriction endonuclease [Algoriphagus sp.]HAS58791.1 restriction endonuclease [Algoriphagus sp.]HCB45329.1 restriction endonuclease [Algoriphagus sp.]|tara:strand:- start:6505 stop:7374 length:870 start_codon:yes stop_codon:yes gene_type:complete
MKKSKNQAEFVQWFGPLLDALRELGYSGKPKEVSERIAQNLELDESFLDETLKSGGNRFHNQVAWARQYLIWEGLLDSSTRGTWKLTEKGKKTILTPEESREIFLKWVEINQKIRKDKSKKEIIENQEEETPESAEVSAENNLLSVLKSLSPSGFENVCKELLREHGFEKVEVTGKSHDGGIDGFGVLELNPFVSFKVIFQCKRYEGAVSRAQVGDFRNAMIGRAEKGIILTTGSFSREAEKEASRDGAPPIELVDGKKLVEMFEKVELGLKPKVVYDVDFSYFSKFRE